MNGVLPTPGAYGKLPYKSLLNQQRDRTEYNINFLTNVGRFCDILTTFLIETEWRIYAPKN